MDKEYMIVREAADHFKIPPSRIYRWIEEGRLKEYSPEYSERPKVVKTAEVQDIIDSYSRIVPREKEEKA